MAERRRALRSLDVAVPVAGRQARREPHRSVSSGSPAALWLPRAGDAASTRGTCCFDAPAGHPSPTRRDRGLADTVGSDRRRAEPLRRIHARYPWAGKRHPFGPTADHRAAARAQIRGPFSGSARTATAGHPPLRCRAVGVAQHDQQRGDHQRRLAWLSALARDVRRFGTSAAGRDRFARQLDTCVAATRAAVA